RFSYSEQSGEICICEAKGKDGDILRQDVSKFDINREAAGKNTSFPGILIANTHNKFETLEKKDSRIPSNVVEYAVLNNILIIRTLDLFNLLDLYQEDKIKNEDIIEKITHSNGWMKVSQNTEILHK